MTKRSWQFSLEVVLLAIVLFSGWLAQYLLLLKTQQGDANPLPAKILGPVNFVIAYATLHYYKRYQRRAIWIAAFVALLATFVVTLVFAFWKHDAV